MSNLPQILIYGVLNGSVLALAFPGAEVVCYLVSTQLRLAVKVGMRSN